MAEKLHICAACGFEYESGGIAEDFHDLPDEWPCPGCGISKEMFHHYACDEIIIEMTGKLAPYQPFMTIELRHHDPAGA